MKKQRIDQILLNKGIAKNIHEAQSLIYAGKVHTKDRKINKPSEMIDVSSDIYCKKKHTNFVSRGGDKLHNFLVKTKLNKQIKNKIILDVGSSTGGFTHCLLSLGAKKVIALDVGTNQLSWEIRTNPKVISLEKTDIRDFTPSNHPDINLLVADISFNSLTFLAKFLIQAFKNHPFEALVLVKPQFELNKEDVPHGGVVEDPNFRQKAIQKVIHKFEEYNIKCMAKIDSDVLGKNGNIETFLHLKEK